MTIPLDERVPNRTLKAIRLALQMSQSEFAAAVRHAGKTLGEPNTCNKRLIQKWESGEHTEPRPNYKRALSSVARLPYEQLGFSTTSDMPVIAVRPGTVVSARGSVNGQPTRSASDPAARLTMALERPARASAEAVGIAQTYVDRLFVLEQHRPSRLIAAPAARHVSEIAVILAGTGSESLRRRLAAIGGRAAALAGWLDFDTGDIEGAHRYWDGALAAARQAADGPSLACVLTYMSYSAAERGDPATAWQLAHTAMSHAGRDVRSRAWMAGRAAQEAAELGERSAALAELDVAVSLAGGLTQAVPGDKCEPWAWFIDAAYVHAMAANVHVRLGDADAALRAAEDALSAVGDQQTKTRALVLAEVACAGAFAQQLDLVERVAIQAVELAVSLESTLARRRLRSLFALLTRYQASVTGRKVIQELQSKLANDGDHAT